MISKESLLLDAPIDNNVERLRRLLEYDQQQNGVKLYRYRHIADMKSHDLEALEKCQIWASNPACFDDAFEFIPSCSSEEDYKCMRQFLIEILPKYLPESMCKKLVSDFDLIVRAPKKKQALFYKFYTDMLKLSRCGYAVSCFTENSPLDKDHNMWDQYAKGSGICLEYSLLELIRKHVIIDPVYYVGPGEKSFANFYKLFGQSKRIGLSFCIKDQYGQDKDAKDKETICWADQNEWRYAMHNTKNSENKFGSGLYLDRVIKPDIVYAKNLDSQLCDIVKRIAEQNNLRFEVI